MTQKYIPFSEIVVQLKKICDSKATGTMFVVTQKNKSAQVMIEKGKIVFIYFFNKRGQAAIDLMKTIAAGTYRFQEGTVNYRPMDLPDTRVILQTLAGVENDGYPELETGSGSVEETSVLSPAQRSVLEECLADYIGPMAGIICEDYLGTVPDVATAVDLLAAEIPSAAQGEQFKEQVRAKIR